MSLPQMPGSASPGRSTQRINDSLPVSTRLAYLPVAVFGLAPLLPLIGLMYLVKLLDSSKIPDAACDECLGPDGCPYFHCCRESYAAYAPSERRWTLPPR